VAPPAEADEFKSLKYSDTSLKHIDRFINPADETKEGPLQSKLKA